MTTTYCIEYILFFFLCSFVFSSPFFLSIMVALLMGNVKFTLMFISFRCKFSNYIFSVFCAKKKDAFGVFWFGVEGEWYVWQVIWIICLIIFSFCRVADTIQVSPTMVWDSYYECSTNGIEFASKHTRKTKVVLAKRRSNKLLFP